MESDLVVNHVRRARKAGLPCSLTTGQWRATLKHFQDRCAYCGGPNDVLEHVVPLSWGGGTTYANCIPACNSCNTCKDHPKFLLFGSNENAVAALLRIKSYLSNLGEPFNEEAFSIYLEYQKTKRPCHYNFSWSKFQDNNNVHTFTY